MPSLNVDLVRRVERLPKPKRTSDALIPLFEAISNSIHSVQARHKNVAAKRGLIHVRIVKSKGRRPLTVTVSDNGVGLDAKNYNAFITTDTDNKIEIGGKGVGRLLWLDCFKGVSVASNYATSDKMRKRSFDFVLSNSEQIQNYADVQTSSSEDSGFNVTFSGLKDNGYSDRFPSRLAYVFQHLTSHFLPAFIGGKCPQIIVDCEGEIRNYPEEVENHIHRRMEINPLSTDQYGEFRFVLMECDKVASSDLKGTHFVHFIAHDRTVHSQRIDGKLGIKYFGEDDRVFHACLFGKFLDTNVNQERTSFVFEDSVIENIVNDVCMPHIKTFLSDPIGKQKTAQGRIISRIVSTYPSVEFGSEEELHRYVPLGELADDAIYGHLSRERYRRDEKQAAKVRSALSRLKGDKIDPDEFQSVISEAAAALEDTSQKSLAEYIIRRKVVLDFLRLLVQKVRVDVSDSSYQREDALHSFLCPMRVSTVGKKAEITQAASHDLWVIDERLTFSQYFSSDSSFDELAATYESEERPDLIVFDRVHGMRQAEDSGKVLLVEFKRPGRTGYADDENPQLQVERYVKRLLSGTVLDVGGRPVRLKPDTVFYCFIVADMVGKMADWTYSWSATADGRGRLYQPRSGFNGSIELVEWDALLDDAFDRNKAFFDRAGISGESLFSTMTPGRKKAG